MKGFVHVVFFAIPPKRRGKFSEDIHYENLPIRVEHADTEEEGWSLLNNLPNELKHNSALVIIVPQKTDLIKTIRKEYRLATILVWDEKICSPKAKKAGANAAFNYSWHMTIQLLREIMNCAEELEASV